jgi:hypothetical protein
MDPEGLDREDKVEGWALAGGVTGDGGLVAPQFLGPYHGVHGESAMTWRDALDRCIERLSWTAVVVGYAFGTAAAAEAAQRDAWACGIPSTVTRAETGSVLVLNARYRDRAERLIPALRHHS